MKKTATLLYLPLLLLLSFTNQQHSLKKTFRQLAVLKGTWKMSSLRGDLYEQWSAANKTTLTGRSYMIKNNKEILLENVTLHHTHENIFYTPVVSNQNNRKPVEFKLTSSGNNLFVFENPLHDYPKRISYHFINNDSLHAWIDDGKENSIKKSDFFYKRVN